MATQNQDLRFRLIGQDVSAGKTFSKVATDARSAHSAISQLGQTLGSTGAFVPFTQGLDAISTGFQHIQENGKSARVIMQGVGIGVAAAGAALLGLGAAAQQAHAGLKQAVEDAGGVYSDYAKAVEDTVEKTATFGRTSADTQNALARLVTATGDPQKALSLMGLTADIAASRNMNLTDSAQMLTSALAGNTRVFRQFGINVGTGKLSADQLNAALQTLADRLSGRAQAQADAFSGRIKAVGVEFENAFESLTKFSPLLLTVGASLTIASAGWDLLAKAKARNAAQDAINISSSRRVATAEVEAGAAAAAAAAAAGGFSGAGFGAIGEAGAVGIIGPAFTKGRFLKAGGLAVGGLLAGQLAGSVLGNGAGGSAVSNAITFGGTGAALGSFFGPEGTLIGGGIGAAGGALLGLLHHGSGQRGKLEQIDKQIATQQQQQNDQAFANQIQGYLPGEFDALGTPKAKKVADATEALAKAKTKLQRAQEDLNKTLAKGNDPEKLAAAEQHLTAAQANLEKAQYVGGTARVASAQAAVDQARAAVTKAKQGTDDTAARRRVADAHQAVDDAHKKLQQAKADITGMSASDLLARGRGNLATARQNAADQARLVDKFHLTQPLIAEIDAANKQVPGTLHHIAVTMTSGLAKQLLNQETNFDKAGKAFSDAASRAFKTPAQALGKILADETLAGYVKRFNQGLSPLPANWHLPAGAVAGAAGARAFLGSPSAGIVQSTGGTMVVVQNANITAQNPQQLGTSLANLARHKALSGAYQPRLD